MSVQVASQESLRSLNVPDRLIGESIEMVALKLAARGLPAHLSTIMIQGELGTGKESLARYIHENSLRSDRPFVPVDCSSLDDLQFERELFGYVRGAFDGAVRDLLGFIRSADGGSLYLDEIGELDLRLQSRLLDVLRQKLVVPVGDTIFHPVDVRFFAASTRNLEILVQQGKFLEDLHRMLNVVVLRTRTLKNRPNDILPLAQHFLALQADLYDEPLKKISQPVAHVLQAYDWPGNVRELANVIEQSHILASNDMLELGDIPLRLQNATAEPEEQTATLSLDELERQTIMTALKRSNYNRARASRMLGINIQRLKRRIIRLGLQSLVRD